MRLPRILLVAVVLYVAYFADASCFGQQIVWVEAESLEDKGGWVVDQQFMELMGSPYVLAHGLGEPVNDAKGSVSFDQPGTYRVWVRTRDWVATWGVEGAPGKFQVLVDGKALETTFGTEGAKWHWQDGGTIKLESGDHAIGLHDLTGFEGRCDTILFCKDLNYQPPDSGEELAKLRAQHLGWNLDPKPAGKFDFVIVGGGVAGTVAAISAARQGLKVALIQDRPVLGGNGSSEVRVWPEGHTNHQPYPRIGDIVNEVVPPKPFSQANAVDAKYYDDARKLKVVEAEPNISLFLNHRVIDATAEAKSVQSVVAQHTEAGNRISISGKFFADCTGDGVLGALVGADFELMKKGNLGASNLWKVDAIERNEPQIKCECKDDEALALAFQPATTEQPFPRCPWAVDLSDVKFPGRGGSSGQWRSGAKPLSNLGGWFWESGSGKHPINDMEWVRDYNFRVMFGAWDVLKNVDGLYPNHRLKWAAHIIGKRESRRLIGDVVLTAEHFRKDTAWPDPAFPCTWHIDIHAPDPQYDDPKLDEPFISRATTGPDYKYNGPYWAPYRCLYSRNIKNLFMAGRDISVSHDGLGAVRVMRTCGMMGETIGKAAWIAIRRDTDPRGVYEKHLDQLKQLMSEPGLKRRKTIDSELELIIPPGFQLVSGQLSQLAGIVVDDSKAELKGKWQSTGSLRGFIGQGYVYTNDPSATAKFKLEVSKDGRYDVRITWQPHQNRAKSMRVEMRSGDQTKSFLIDQTKPASGSESFQSLGKFEFKAGQPGSLVMHAKDANGTVHADAVQLIKLDSN